MEKSRPVSLYNVYLYCDKCGGLMKEINFSVGAATHSLGYDYRCEQCGDTVVSYMKYPYVKYEEKNETHQP